MIENSKFYHFIDEKNNFIIRFLDAQKLIHDLALLHLPTGRGQKTSQNFSFFRDLIISNIHLLSYLKHKESIGLFIDSETPFYRFKLELHEVGAIRTLILPKGFDQYPDSIQASLRLVKFFPHNSRPYTSHLELEQLKPAEVINFILQTTYQVQSTVLVSEKCDQSLLVMKLPDSKVKDQESSLSLNQYILQNKKSFHKILDQNFESEQEVHQAFSSLGSNIQYIYGKEVCFQCPCSKEQMVTGVASLAASQTLEDIFEGKQTIETNCDYCHSKYILDKEEVQSRMTLN